MLAAAAASSLAWASTSALWSPPSRSLHLRPRHASPVLQTPPFTLPYDTIGYEKPFADYEWDPSFPGSFKPGTRRENQDLDDVLAEWEGKDNPACMELPQDQPWQVPLAPAEDILSWLSRVGLLTEEENSGEDDEVPAPRGDSLLEDEFDLSDVLDPTADLVTTEAGGVDAGIDPADF